MTIDHRATSTDIAQHCRTADAATFYDCPPDYRQDFERGTLARIHRPAPASWVFLFPIVAIIALAAAATFAIRFL